MTERQKLKWPADDQWVQMIGRSEHLIIDGTLHMQNGWDWPILNNNI